MSWFRRASSSDSAPASNAPQNPLLQNLKRQARNRLIGMLVLILAGIALFTWVLDSEPRQSDREIVYDIPARGERLSVQIPAAAQKDTAQKDAAASAPAHAAATLAPASSADTPAQIRARRRAALAENEELLDEAPLAAGSDEPAPNAAQAAAAKALADKAQAAADKLARDKAAKAQQAKQEQSAQDLADKADKAKADKLAKAEKEKTEKAKADKAKADEATRARALLEGKTEAKSDPKAEAKSDPKAEAKTDPKADAKTTHERSVVQFGSFSDSAKAAEVRHKVEATGLKTYTQEIDTPRGKLIRLRVGPFNKAEDADAAAKKIKALGLPAAILTL